MTDTPASTLQQAVTPPLYELAQALRARRIQLGMSQLELASKLGCAQTRISQWENGRRSISIPAFANWAEALGGKIQLTLIFPPAGPIAISATLEPGP